MDNQSTELARVLHLIFCEKEHEDVMENLVQRNNRYCYWYLEESIEDQWNCEDHKLWLLKARLFEARCAEGGLNPAEVTDKIANLIEVCRHLLDFYEVNPELRTYIVDLLTNLQ